MDTMTAVCQVDIEVRDMILGEIEKLPEYMKMSRNPLVHAVAVKNLMLKSYLALYFSAGPATKVDSVLAYKQLDLSVAKYHDQKMSPTEFVDRLLGQILPENMFFLIKVKEV